MTTSPEPTPARERAPAKRVLARQVPVSTPTRKRGGKGVSEVETPSDGSAPARDRREKALRLRIAGATFGEIAGEGGFRSAADAFQAVRVEARAVPEESPEDARRLMMARLDAMLAGVWIAATEGDPMSVGAVLKIEERREHLLNIEAERAARERADQAPPPANHRLRAFGFSTIG